MNFKRQWVHNKGVYNNHSNKLQDNGWPGYYYGPSPQTNKKEILHTQKKKKYSKITSNYSRYSKILQIPNGPPNNTNFNTKLFLKTTTLHLLT